MEEFEITITETLQRKVKVKAENYDKAISKITSAYETEKIVLDPSDFIEVDIK